MGTASLELRWTHPAIVGFGLILLSLMGAYFLAENWECPMGRAVSC